MNSERDFLDYLADIHVVMGFDGKRDHWNALKIEAVLNENAKQGWKFRPLQARHEHVVMAR